MLQWRFAPLRMYSNNNNNNNNLIIITIIIIIIIINNNNNNNNNRQKFLFFFYFTFFFFLNNFYNKKRENRNNLTAATSPVNLYNNVKFSNFANENLYFEQSPISLNSEIFSEPIPTRNSQKFRNLKQSIGTLNANKQREEQTSEYLNLNKWRI